MLDNLFLMAPPEGGEGGGMMNMIFLGSIFVVMYFFMIRPQIKKSREQKSFMENLKKGDDVITTGGLHGKVLNVNETTVQLDIDNNTKVLVEKANITIPKASTKK